MEEQHEKFGLARIALKYTPELMTWFRYKHFSKLPMEQLDLMEKNGIELGATPKEWFALFNDVPAKDWLNIEIWYGKEWVNHI
jgi:hypothetical protein